MLNNVKGRILEIINSVEAAAGQLPSAKGAEAQELRAIISEATESIGNAAAESEAVGKIGAEIREILDKLTASPARKRLREIFAEYRAALDAIPTQFKVLFLPYYENTWDSLKSIYEAFAADDRFVCEIVIIPIRRNTAAGGVSEQYEDYLTPQGIPNTDYNRYDIESDLPDIVFYNNPYDAVTIEKYQSFNIKRFARCMIYVPYYLLRNQSFNPDYFPRYLEIIPRSVALSGHNSADFIIAQCTALQKLAGKYSKNGPKMRVLGSPKCDYLYTAQKDGLWPHHVQWESILQGKKVFMLNTHFGMFEKPESPVELLGALFDFIGEREDTALIWRPHPQTFFVYEGQINERIQKFYDLLGRAENEQRIILDRTGTALSAFMYSDVLISSDSSIVGEALFLDKPVFLLSEDRVEMRTDIADYADLDFQRILKYSHSVDKNNVWMYQAVERIGLTEALPENLSREDLLALYREKAHKEPFMKFMQDILAGKDTKKELRAAYRAQTYAHPDGTCGEAVLHFVETLL